MNPPFAETPNEAVRRFRYMFASWCVGQTNRASLRWALVQPTHLASASIGGRLPLEGVGAEGAEKLTRRRVWRGRPRPLAPSRRTAPRSTVRGTASATQQTRTTRDFRSGFLHREGGQAVSPSILSQPRATKRRGPNPLLTPHVPNTASVAEWVTEATE